VIKEVLVDRIVERNVETIKQVHAGLERVVPIYVERIKEVRFFVTYVYSTACLHTQIKVKSHLPPCPGTSFGQRPAGESPFKF